MVSGSKLACRIGRRRPKLKVPGVARNVELSSLRLPENPASETVHALRDPAPRRRRRWSGDRGHEVLALEKIDTQLEAVGLSLAESKALLRCCQQRIVMAQAGSFVDRCRCCPDCGFPLRGLHRIDNLPHYLDRLRNDPDEIKALADDLTINVTGFFRDPEAWNAAAAAGDRAAGRASGARRVRPGLGARLRDRRGGLLDRHAAHRGAAGRAEEPRHEGLRDRHRRRGALALARAGLYPGGIDADVPPERLRRFFERRTTAIGVKKALREAVVFAPQNLLQDPPFSRLDLISCRNLLIYLEPDVQRRVLSLLHFALREGGHLFLGTTETIGGVRRICSSRSPRSGGSTGGSGRRGTTAWSSRRRPGDGPAARWRRGAGGRQAEPPRARASCSSRRCSSATPRRAC